MKNIVIDASIAIKWFVPEIHAIAAARLLNNSFNFLVPDLIFAEVGNILWKKYRLKELSYNVADAILNDFKRLPFESYNNEDLLDTAWQIATAYERSLYDSLYLALAQTKGCLFVTADRALYNALKLTKLKDLLLWIEDIKK